MKKQSILVTALIFSAILFSSCSVMERQIRGDGHLKTEDRPIGSFESISVEGSMNVELTQGAVQDAKIEGEENLLPYLETNVENGRLVIKFKDGLNIQTTRPINVYVTAPAVQAVSMAGSGEVKSTNTLANTQEISVDMAGSGNIALKLNSPQVKASIAGSGDITLEGETRDMDINILGSGNLKGSNLKSENAKVKIAGSGNADIYASTRLETNIAGSGNVNYRGNPTIESHSLGSGSVQKVD